MARSTLTYCSTIQNKLQRYIKIHNFGRALGFTKNITVSFRIKSLKNNPYLQRSASLNKVLDKKRVFWNITSFSEV